MESIPQYINWTYSVDCQYLPYRIKEDTSPRFGYVDASRDLGGGDVTPVEPVDDFFFWALRARVSDALSISASMPFLFFRRR
jgi:hypothetical protein